MDITKKTRVLELNGLVEVDEYASPIEICVGGKNLTEEVLRVFPETGPAYGYPRPEKPELTVLIAHGGDQHLYRDACSAYEGEADYSELTPGMAPYFRVGSLDLLGQVEDLEGVTVSVRVDNGPPLPEHLRPAPPSEPWRRSYR